MRPQLIVGILWIAFWSYWAISAIGVKKDTYRAGGLSRWFFGPLIWVIVIFVVVRNHAVHLHSYPISHSPLVSGLGILILALGLAFAIWARLFLGKNWSPQPAVKSEHELVTGGPYRWVRHPIYTGILVGFLGTALVAGPIWFVMLGLLGLIFGYRIKVEERLMTEQFPNAYPEYKARTKALIPFVA